eukprot:gene1662-biopygen1422
MASLPLRCNAATSASCSSSSCERVQHHFCQLRRGAATKGGRQQRAAAQRRLLPVLQSSVVRPPVLQAAGHVVASLEQRAARPHAICQHQRCRNRPLVALEAPREGRRQRHAATEGGRERRLRRGPQRSAAEHSGREGVEGEAQQGLQPPLHREGAERVLQVVRRPTGVLADQVRLASLPGLGMGLEGVHQIHHHTLHESANHFNQRPGSCWGYATAVMACRSRRRRVLRSDVLQPAGGQALEGVAAGP